MSTATLTTVVESFTSRDGLLVASVLLIGDRHVVDLDDVRTGQTIERLTYSSRLDASRAARSLAWGETLPADAEEDAMVHAMLAEVADVVAAWKDETPTPTPAGVSETATLDTPTPVPTPALETPARKLTPAQASSLETIRLAIPSGLAEVGEVRAPATVGDDGIVRTGDHRAQTLTALADRGAIDPIEISRSWTGDRLRFLGPLGIRAARVSAAPGHPACVCWVIKLATPDGRALGTISGREKSRECNVEVPTSALAAVREIMLANGWTLVD